MNSQAVPGPESLRRLPLAGAHERASAAFAPFFGWSVVRDYGDFDAEYRAAAGSAAVLDASFLTQITASGRDAADYLNRRLSQLMLGLAPGESRRATLLDALGKMEADLEAHAREDSFLVLAPPHEGAQLAALLERFVFSEDCAFRDVTPDSAIFAVTGPSRGEAVGKAAAGGEVLECSYFPESSLVRVPVSDAAAAFERLRAHARPIGWEAFNAHRIARRCPWWGMDLDRETIPLEADLLEAIHFDKGCYPGQETIARITNLGHPSRKLVALEIEGTAVLEPGAELTTADGRPAGRVTSAALLPGAASLLALGFVKWPHRALRTELVVSGRRAIVLGGRTESAA